MGRKRGRERKKEGEQEREGWGKSTSEPGKWQRGWGVGGKSEEDLGCRIGRPVWSKLEVRRGTGKGWAFSF